MSDALNKKFDDDMKKMKEISEQKRTLLSEVLKNKEKLQL